MTRLMTLVGWLFGLLLLALSIFVALETVSRKLFNFSFQGADELGGYVLAVGGALSFTIALLERAHIRIDLVHGHLPAKAQAILNTLAIVLLAAMGFFFAIYCWPVVRDTLTYRSTAATPWATPLIYPQAIWYGALVVFTASSLWLAVRAVLLMFTGQIEALNQRFHPKGALEELADELDDIKSR